ncbi:hypothetical protein AAG906_029624 [Vitis piasezkii]
MKHRCPDSSVLFIPPFSPSIVYTIRHKIPQMPSVKQFFTGMSDSGKHTSISKRNKKLFLLVFSSVLLIAAVVGIVAGVHSRKSSTNDVGLTAGHAVLKSACSSTRYPDLCYSAIATVPGASKKVTSQKDVIAVSLNITVTAVEHNYFTIEKLLDFKNLTKREKAALHDCLETIDETLDELHVAMDDLDEYPDKKSLTQHADDLKTLMSAAMTNQETCLDGFSHDDADKHVREVLLKGQRHVEHMCSNALAMIKNMTDTDIAREREAMNRKLMEERDESGWPKWLSAGDRRLLQSSSVTPDVVVAADGSGDYKTVSAAVAAAPEKSSKRYIIGIKAGVYKENVEVGKKKTNIMFLGDGRSNTIITGSKNVVDGSTTFNSATVAVVGEKFLARDITFQNTAGPSKHQAVALRVGSDLSAFYKCDMLAYQDTLYVHSNRQFYINCLVAGTVDFIFGNAAAVFQDCDIHARRPNSGQKNMLTAQGRTDPNQNTGIVIQKCRIGATSDLQAVISSFKTYLGRPWKEYSRTVVMQTSITNVIDPAGWHEWSGSFALSTLYYGEYQNTGAGAGTSKRVTWKGFKVITSASEAQGFTPGTFIAGSSWLGSTGFPYSLGKTILDSEKTKEIAKKAIGLFMRCRALGFVFLDALGDLIFFNCSRKNHLEAFLDSRIEDAATQESSLKKSPLRSCLTDIKQELSTMLIRGLGNIGRASGHMEHSCVPPLCWTRFSEVWEFEKWFMKLQACKEHGWALDLGHGEVDLRFCLAVKLFKDILGIWYMDSIKSFKGYGKVDELEERAFKRKTRKRLIILIISSVVLVAVIIGAVAGTLIHKSKSESNSVPASPVSPATSIKAVCSVTQYPDSCRSSSDSLRVAIAELSKLSSLPRQLSAKSNDAQLKKALGVCETVFEDAIDRLNDSISSMEVREGEKLLSASKIDDIKTWLSATITDQETCLDALEELNSTLLNEVKTAMQNSTVFASNSLAIVAKLIGILHDLDIQVHRKLLSFSNSDQFPDWVGAGERRLLQETKPTPDVTVAKDGTGDYVTIKEAVAMVPKKSEKRFVIYVKEGNYSENIILDKSKWNVMIYGDGKDKSIVSGNLNFIDGTPTFATATFAAVGKGFIAKYMRFENTAGAVKHQAVAFRSGSDMSVFYQCSFDAFQDTLYAHSNRQFYRECDITGTIDFIFGNAAVVFQACKIQPRQPMSNQFNTITAQGKKDPNQNTGISIQKCSISALNTLTAPTYLGRPWKAYSTTIVMQSNIGSFLNPKGWTEWVTGVDPPSTIFYAEFQNTGPGATLDQRVKWAGFMTNITEDEAAKFTVGTFIQGTSWLSESSVTFDASL